ncbi:arsenate reductase ArsC [Pseudomonas protegens]|uniref:arsenate reductase ArsC n=1 Tax=Pseudomonas protegens TaxID=380021 RepID=UPI00383AD25C
MSERYRVLFVCPRNDARSLIAEALLRHTDSTHFEASSAGLTAGEVNERTLETLEHIGVDASGLRSKSIDEFQGQDFHYVITLWEISSDGPLLALSSGEAITWHFEDPATSKKPEAFRHALQEIHDRVKMFVTVKTRYTED